MIIKFTGVNNRDEANKLKNGLLQINRDQTVKLPPGHYYQFQVIGLDVFDSHHNYLGRVSEILETGANDVYIVKSDHKKDLLIPALKSIVLKIDIPHKQMLVELPPGLDE